MQKIKIPIVHLRRENDFFKKEIKQGIEKVFSTQHWILGEVVNELEGKIAKYVGTKYAIGVASGTDAILLALNSLAKQLRGKVSFNTKDEIITTPFTFIATAEAIVRSGATPVFADIDPDTFNISPQSIKKTITKNTIGILPVHLYGLAAPMDEINKIAKAHNLFVVEDACQAFGAALGNKKLGSLGAAGAFSCFPTKNLGCWGDGGFMTTNSYQINEFVRVLRNHGQVRRYDSDFISYNSRLDSIQAAVLLAKLKHIDKLNDRRRVIAKKYNEAFKGLKEIKLPQEFSGSHHIYHLYSLVVAKRRDEFMNYLTSKGIESRIYYPIPLYAMAAFKNNRQEKPLKNTAKVLAEVVSLPLDSFLKDNEIDYVIKTVLNFF